MITLINGIVIILSGKISLSHIGLSNCIFWFKSLRAKI